MKEKVDYIGESAFYISENYNSLRACHNLMVMEQLSNRVQW